MPGDDLTVRRADDADLPAILGLAEKTLGWGNEPRWAELFRWKHEANPFGRSPAWVAEVDGRLAGFRVLLRWEWQRPDGTILPSVRAVDTATDPDFQGRGVFTRLTLGAIAELEAEGCGFVFNTPNHKSLPGYLKMGWQVVGTQPVMVAPGRFTGARRTARARTAAEIWSEPCSAGAPAPDVLATPGVEQLVGAQPFEDGLVTHRTLAHLRWRYSLPALRYRVLTLGADPADGLVVFRVRRRGPATEALVADALVPPTPDARRRRRRLVRRVARQAGADHVLVAGDRALLGAPAVPVPRLGPVVTWRSLRETTAPTLDRWHLTLGDVELF